MRFGIRLIARDGRYLMARHLDPGDFDWPPGTLLAGRRIRGISIPRALDADGKPRTDLFEIEVPTAGLAVGQIVELTSRVEKEQ